MYTGLLLTGICENIYLRSRLTLYKWVFIASIQRPQRIRNWTVVFNFLTNVSTGLFCSGYDNDRQKSSRSFVVLLTINATVRCLHAFSRALQLETGQVYLLQGVSLVHCLMLLLLAKVIRESSLSMVWGGWQKLWGFNFFLEGEGVIRVSPLPEGGHLDDQNLGNTRFLSSSPSTLPPPPPP